MRQTRDARARVDHLVSALGPGPWPASDVLALGWSRSALRAAVDAGRLIRPVRGVVALPTAEPDARSSIRAALVATGDAVAVRDSAAAVHGLWLPDAPARDVELTARDGVSRRSTGKRLRSVALADDDVTVVDGIPVTTIGRTAMDLARGRPLPAALLVMDSAARALIAVALDRTDLRVLRDPRRRAVLSPPAIARLVRAFEPMAGLPGSVALREALDLVDPASESPHESRCRAWVHEAGLPAPRVGWRVAGASGKDYYGDLVWESARLVCEADGFGKYGRTEAEVRRALRDERARQADLEDAGWRVVRVATNDRRAAAIARLERHLR